METLRRLRFVWAVLSLIAAAICALGTAAAFFTNAQPPMPLVAGLWTAAALCSAFGLYARTLVGKITVVWLGGAGLLMVGALAMHAPLAKAVAQAGFVVGGTWAVAAVVIWVLQPAVARLLSAARP